MEIFKISKTEDISLNAVKAVQTQLQLNIDENSAFLRSRTGDTYFFRDGYDWLNIWKGSNWIAIADFSTRMYFEYFRDLIKERNNKSKTSSESFTLDKMIETISEETWKQLAPNVQAQIIARLLSK